MTDSISTATTAPRVHDDACVVPLATLTERMVDGVTIRRLVVSGASTVPNSCTAFLVARTACEVGWQGHRFPIPAHGYAVLPEGAECLAGEGLVLMVPNHSGLFAVGGPVESRGRLRYIDGCSDTVLVAPTVRGDPCLNLLHVPPGTVQTDHDHPSIRVGLIVDGRGRCVIGRDDGPPTASELAPGSVFVLPTGTTHRFETADDPLLIVAWHPDSDTGPTDDDHPMLNRTLRPASVERVR